MSQQTTMRALDASIHDAFERAGIAEEGTYTAPGGGAGVACRVYRDDVTLETFGDARPTSGMRTELAIFRADVAAPARGGTVLLDGTTFTLEALVEQDQSLSRWTVRG